MPHKFESRQPYQKVIDSSEIDGFFLLFCTIGTEWFRLPYALVAMSAGLIPMGLPDGVIDKFTNYSPVSEGMQGFSVSVISDRMYLYYIFRILVFPRNSCYDLSWLNPKLL